MCFHEASKLNQGHSPKTFIAPSRQGGVATRQSGATQSTNLANKSAVTQSKVSVASKAGGGANLKQPSGGSIGKDGVPQVTTLETFYIPLGQLQSVMIKGVSSFRIQWCP